MKSSLLYSLLLGLVATSSFADNTVVVNPPIIPSPVQTDRSKLFSPRITNQIDCNYHISDQSSDIGEELISKWATKATLQAFDLSPNNVGSDLMKLKACFTDSGWISFMDALKKSGNLTIIKTEQLTVNSLVKGELHLEALRKNQWKITLPIQVIYHNAQKKLVQDNTVTLMVGRKINGDLGIMQMIVAPKV